MKRISLVRLCENKGATLGVLIIDRLPFCSTLEEGWRANKKFVSCIPEGTYKVIQYKSEKFGHCWLLCDVPERAGILIHVGNTAKDTSGCILPGSRWKYLDEDPAVVNSKRTMSNLRNELRGLEEFEIEITWAPILERSRSLPG